MIRYHKIDSNTIIAEVLPGSDQIAGPDEILDIMVESGYHGSNAIILYDKCLKPDFFDLKTGLAGEILQKFSNYRMRLAVIGNFSGYKSKSLKDFIRESNKRGIICFVDSLDEALSRLNSRIG
jgi:hypothetical protein